MELGLFISVTSYLLSGHLVVSLSFGALGQYLRHRLVFPVLHPIQQEMKITILFIKL